MTSKTVYTYKDEQGNEILRYNLTRMKLNKEYKVRYNGHWWYVTKINEVDVDVALEVEE